MSIGNKISEIRKSKKMKIDTLSELSGVPTSTLKKILSGVTKDPQIDTIKAIAKALNCTLEDFDETIKTNNIYSKEETKIINNYRRLDKYGKKVVQAVMDTELERIEETNKIEYSNNIIELPHYSIPYYDISVSAGTGEFLDSEHFEVIDLSEPPPTGANFIVRVSGDSMEPTFFDGDKLFIKQQHSVEKGDIGIFMVDGSVYVKELDYDGLISHNKEYEKIQFNEFTNIRCYGKVLGVCEEKI